MELVENPISDKRLLKLIQQCRTKQVLDYVKKNGEDRGADDAVTKQTPTKATNAKKPESIDESAHKIVVTPHSTEEFTVSAHFPAFSGIFRHFHFEKSGFSPSVVIFRSFTIAPSKTSARTFCAAS